MNINEEIQLDVQATGERILGRWAEIRRHTRAVIEEHKLFKQEGMPYIEHRELVLKQLKTLVENNATQYGFHEELGGQMNPFLMSLLWKLSCIN